MCKSFKSREGICTSSVAKVVKNEPIEVNSGQNMYRQFCKSCEKFKLHPKSNRKPLKIRCSQICILEDSSVCRREVRLKKNN